MKYEAGRGFFLLSSFMEHRSPERPYFKEKRIFYYPESNHICMIDNSGEEKSDGFSHIFLETSHPESKWKKNYHLCHDKKMIVSYFSDDMGIFWRWDSYKNKSLERVATCPCKNKKDIYIKELIAVVYRRIYKDIKKVLEYRRQMLSYRHDEMTVKRNYLQRKKEGA